MFFAFAIVVLLTKYCDSVFGFLLRSYKSIKNLHLGF